MGLLSVVLASTPLAACAGSADGPAAYSHSTAIYSAPVRLGGRGSIMFLPAPQSRSNDKKAVLQTPTAAWLVGHWIQGYDNPSREMCASDLTKVYNADGTWAEFGARGRWNLNGDRLNETLSELLEEADPKDWPKVGLSEKYRIRRTGPDDAVILIGQRWMTMLRCKLDAPTG